MIFRLIRRLFFAGVLFFALVAGTVTVAGFLATRTPAFYAELLEDSYTEEDVEAAGLRFQQQRSAFVDWRRQLARAASDAVVPVAFNHAALDQPPTTHLVVTTEADLNAVLSDGSTKAGDVAITDPRVAITAEGLRLALAVSSPIGDFVLSAAFRPLASPADVPALELVDVRVGQLPLPCNTLLSFCPRERTKLQGGLYLDLTGARPRLELDHTRYDDAVSISAVTCLEGKLVVELSADADDG